MKKTLIIINTAALILAIAWMISTGFDFEPTIAVLTLTATLIAILLVGQKKKNKVTVKGIKNVVEVDVRNEKSSSESESDNELHVEGDWHNVKVDTDNK